MNARDHAALTSPRSYVARKRYQRLEVAAGYDAERFGSWHGRVAHRMELCALRRALRDYCSAPGTVLDLPCGTARLLEAYGATASLQVTGADISEYMLAQARHRFEGDDRFEFRIADAEALPFEDGAFDYLVSFRLMCHLPPVVRRRVLSEMVRVTRRILIINYHFDVRSPLMLINRMLRRDAGRGWFVSDVAGELEGQAVELCAVRKLSWFERSSAVVVLRRTSDVLGFNILSNTKHAPGQRREG